MSKFKVGDVVVLKEDGGVFGLELYSRQVDDELPPAPESVQYNAGLQQANTLTAETINCGGLYGGACVCIGVESMYSGVLIASVLTPDEALQLCHDLRRMAMDLKRKGKRND